MPDDMTGLIPLTATTDTAPDLGRCALLIDFDGTLVDLAETPDGIDTTGVAALLAHLKRALDGRVVVVTGRPVEDLLRHLPGCPVPVYGSHGAELWREGEMVFTASSPPVMAEMRQAAQDFGADTSDVLFEDKPLGFALHFRQAPEQEEPVRSFLDDLTDDADEVAVQSAKMAYEVKAGDVDKGTAVRDAVTRFGWQGHAPVMIGDDVTDETGMAAAKALGGFGIKVGEGETVAEWRVASPAALRRVFEDRFGAIT